MELQGKVIAALPEKSGTSARGEWKVQEFVIETHDQYPRKMVFSVFGADRLQRFNISVGQEVSVSFDIDAHEYNGRWFNSLRAWKVDRNVAAPAEGPYNYSSAAPQVSGIPAPTPAAGQNASDGLPFPGPAAVPAPQAPAASQNAGDDLPF